MYKKLPERVKISAEQKEKIFRLNPFDQRLATHKLSGKLKNYWSFSIGDNNRIVFSFVENKEVHFHAIGTHRVYSLLERSM